MKTVLIILSSWRTIIWLVVTLLVGYSVWQVTLLYNALYAINSGTAQLILSLFTVEPVRIVVWKKILSYALLFCEVAFIGFVVAQVVINVKTIASIAAQRIWARFSMFVAVTTSLVFALYAYTYIWGDAVISGFVIKKYYNPEQVSFALAISVMLWTLAYIASQLPALLARKVVLLRWYVINIVSSALWIGIVGWAELTYMFGTLHPTVFQVALLKLWSLTAIIDLCFMAINYRIGTAEHTFLGDGVETTVH